MNPMLLLSSLPGWARIAVYAVILLSVVRLLMYLGKGRSKPDYMVVATCPACRWKGEVSRYKPICRQCNNLISLRREGSDKR